MKKIGFFILISALINFLSCSEKQESTFHYFPDGTVKSETRPINDTVNVFLRYFANGTVKDSMTELDGFVSGEVKHYFENGQLEKVWVWRDGLPNGACTTHYKSGRVMNILTYRDSIIVGDAVEYYDLPGKKIHYKANYAKVHGKKWANWQLRYDTSGNLSRTTTCIKAMKAPRAVFLGDSLKIEFQLQYPEYPDTKVYFGDYDSEYNLGDTSSIKGFYGSKNDVTAYVHAKKLGRQTVRGVLENYKLIKKLKSGLIKTEGKMIYWSYDYEVKPKEH